MITSKQLFELQDALVEVKAFWLESEYISFLRIIYEGTESPKLFSEINTSGSIRYRVYSLLDNLRKRNWDRGLIILLQYIVDNDLLPSDRPNDHQLILVCLDQLKNS